MSDTPHVAVLGAGVCGLYAARVLTAAGTGIRVTVLEKENVVGGLAAGRLHDDNYYDLGVHHLHAFDRGIFADIARLMGGRLLASEKSAKIRCGNGYRRYPLEFLDLLSGIPRGTLANAMLGLAVQSVRNRFNTHPPRHAEEALIRLYGQPLYAYFFRDFTHRYWGIPPSGLSASFVRTKMPRLSAVDVVKRAFGRLGLNDPDGAAVESALARETLYYARTGSRELPMALADFVTSHGGEVRLSSPVESVEASDGLVRAVRYTHHGQAVRLPCDAVISTIPLPLLVRAFERPLPPEVLVACDSLRYKALAVYGLLVRRPRVLDAQFVYYRERIFHRVAEPKNSGMLVEPPDHTLLLAETTCDVGDDRWRGGAATQAQIVRDLEAENVLHASEVADVHVLRAEHGYPVFRLGFEPHRDRLTAFLGRIGNLRSTGRQGGFLYPNMHAAMRMGATAAGELLAALGRAQGT